MSDIIERLRRWTHAVDAAPASDLMDEAADEIERLREAVHRYLAEQDATLSVCDGAVTVTMDATLTGAEREAIADAADRYASLTPESAETVATLRGLLERLGP